MADSNEIEKLNEVAAKAESYAKQAEISNQEAKKSAALVDSFLSSVASISTQIGEDEKKEMPEKKGKSINEYLVDYDYYSGKASEISRSLALAGIAVIWLFKNPEGSTTLFSNSLLLPLWFLVISLFLDLLQYILGSIFWGVFYEIKYHQWKRTNRISEEQAKDIKAPNLLSIPLVLIFFAKIVFMALAYWYIFLYLRIKVSL